MAQTPDPNSTPLTAPVGFTQIQLEWEHPCRVQQRVRGTSNTKYCFLGGGWAKHGCILRSIWLKMARVPQNRRWLQLLFALRCKTGDLLDKRFSIFWTLSSKRPRLRSALPSRISHPFPISCECVHWPN